jgi:Family of unknown function (DUF6221)
MDLAEFLAARLDEDEAAAGAGARRVGMPWRAEPQPGTPGGLVIDDLGLVGSTGGRYAAEHIARHDPARVLREVAAGRAILAEHAATDWTAYGDRMCRRCVLDDDEPHDEPYHWLPFPCPTLRALAAAYSDHPDYDPAWAPAVTGQRGR